MNSGVAQLYQIMSILTTMNKHHLLCFKHAANNLIKLKLHNNCSAQAVNNISESVM